MRQDWRPSICSATPIPRPCFCVQNALGSRGFRLLVLSRAPWLPYSQSGFISHILGPTNDPTFSLILASKLQRTDATKDTPPLRDPRRRRDGFYENRPTAARKHCALTPRPLLRALRTVVSRTVEAPRRRRRRRAWRCQLRRRVYWRRCQCRWRRIRVCDLPFCPCPMSYVEILLDYDVTTY